MNPTTFLIINMALAFYNVGTIWAHEVDIFRSWKLVEPESFLRIQTNHWRKLLYWVFIPVGAGFVGSMILVWYRPPGSPSWAVWGVLGSQLGAHALTALFWGPWQARLSKDEMGPNSPYLAKILRTHWIRTLLITLNAFIFLAWVLVVEGVS
jgi:hypothetical protein